MQKRFEIGQIVNTFGIKGEVKVTPFTDDINRFDDLKEVYVKSKKEERLYQVEGARYHKNMVLLKLKGIENPEDAEKLRNSYLEIDREDAIPLEEGTYFIADLIGLKAVSEDGTELGKITDVLQTGANDVYVVQQEDGQEVLIPAIRDCVLNVDLEAGIMTLHLLDGLLDINKK